MKKVIAFILCISIGAISLAGCSNTGTNQNANNTKDNNSKNIKKNMDYDRAKINEDVIKGNNEFAFRMLNILNQEDASDNIFISPISISTALAMTYNGSETTTKKEMENVLGFSDLERDIVNESFQNLIGHLINIDNKVELNMGNSIWIREGQAIREEFIVNNERNFRSEVDILDFSDPASVERINSWISNATKGKIERMLEPPIDPKVIMYLINAIYFKGQWKEQFNPERTYKDSYQNYNGTEQQVDMMNYDKSIEYVQRDNYQAVRLPYGNGNTSMYCILPEEGLDINEFITGLTADQWKNMKASLRVEEDVLLKLPKFKLEYGIKNLNDSLKALGMGEAFSGSADFSGIRDGIFISRVLHKAVIEVNEEGSEAAAATVVEMEESAREPITFFANRPFIFIISDDVTGTILFMGKVVEL